MFTYDVKPREQVEADTESRFNPWPKGEYEFEVTEATNTVTGPNSKNPGTPMLKLNLTVFNDKGQRRGVFDNLMGSYPDKIMGFCDALGLEYGKPINPDMIKGKSGRLVLKIQPEREYNGQTYDANNAVSYYVKRKGGSASAVSRSIGNSSAPAQTAQTSYEQDLDDSIPF